jgi:hypothetical protein
MRVLLSFETFAGFGGTESYTLTVATELDRLGHDVSIYSPNHGAIAEFARQQGVHVVGSTELPAACDLVIFSDTATCHELADRWPTAVRVFVAHSADYMLQAPPQIHGRCHVIVVLNDRVRRAVESRAWHAPIVRLRQPIDLLRFCYLSPRRSSVRTALVVSNYLEGPRAQAIDRACAVNGIEVNWIGAKSHPTPTPELAIARAELVIGLGRGVLEAMAAGRAAYVYGAVGGDGWVTPERYPAMEADGFAGTAETELVIDGRHLADDLGRWDSRMGEINRDLASSHHSAREHAVELISLARSLDSPVPTEPSHAEELARMVRLQWQSDFRATASLTEAERLGSLLAERESELATLSAQLAETARRLTRTEGDVQAAREQLDALRSTRRYQLACRIARPVDRVRDRLNFPARRGGTNGPTAGPPGLPSA